MHRTTKRFRELYRELPDQIRRRADTCFLLIRDNPPHLSLRFKKIGDFWSARISIGYRALALEDGNDFVWVWIGTHTDYEKIIGRK